MINSKSVASHQIKSHENYSGGDVLRIPENESVHYSIKTDKQIKIPIKNVDEFLGKLKNDNCNNK